jgi:hypothetical protein
MARETYHTAHKRILTELVLAGWSVKADLKVPQAKKDGETLYFHPQAVYLNSHSLFVDIRSMPTADLIATVERRIAVREESQKRTWNR